MPTNDRWISGFARSLSGLNLTLVAPGRLHIGGTLVKFDQDVPKLLTGNATNYVFATKSATVTVNTTGTPPADSILIFTFVTNGTVVTGETDSRDAALVFNVSVKGSKFYGTDSATPTDGSQLARYDIVQSLAASSGVAKSVRAATTAAITLSGTQTVDGAALLAEDRCLAKNQGGTASNAANGIYVVKAGAWVRATDYDASGEVIPGGLVCIQEGTLNKETIWMLKTDGPVTLDTTALEYEQIDYKVHSALTGTSAHGATAAATINAIVARNGSGQASFADAVNDDHAIPYLQAQSEALNMALMMGGM